MTSASDQPVSFEPSTLSEDHPAYATHQAAIRSVQRVINDMAPYQNVEVASTGIGQLLQLQPLILTGAGMSTDSGIPDYRGPEGSLRHSRPMTDRKSTRLNSSHVSISYAGFCLKNTHTRAELTYGEPYEY